MKENRRNQKKWSLMILGVIIFAVLMGIRPEFETMWARAAIAACAGGVLGVVLLEARKPR